MLEPAKNIPDRTPAILWPKIREALTDPTFDMRTFSGLSKALNVDKRAVKAAVAKHRKEIRFSPVRANNGEYLFTLAARRKNWRERVSEIRHMLIQLG